MLLHFLPLNFVCTAVYFFDLTCASALFAFDLFCALQFFPAWCYALPKTILDLPLSIWEALLWVCIPYFAVGYYKNAGRLVSVIAFILSPSWKHV